MVTKEQVASYLKVVRSVAEAVKELGSVPSGVMYAQLMSIMSLDAYNRVLGHLKTAGLIKVSESHLLTWIGPQ